MAASKGNKYAVGNNGGRPPMYSDPAAVQIACDEYFEYIKRSNEPATITGLALYLGFESKQSLYDYSEKEEFSYSIKRARARIEHEYEKGLHEPGCTGAIFALKNFGWKDKQEYEVKQEINASINPRSRVKVIRPTDDEDE
jgi:hypothetical protein